MNPFEILSHLAETGTPPDDGEAILSMSAGLGDSLERIAQETLPFIASGGGELQCVFAPYGRGKTHFLKALSQWARKHGFVTAYVDCQENRSPFASLVETYRAIAASMTPPGTHRFFSSAGITRVIEAQFTDKDEAEQRVLINRLKADRVLAPAFRNLVLAYCTEAVAAGSDEDLAERLEALLAATPTYRVTLGELYRKYSYLPKPMGKLTKRNAAVWLRALLSLPWAFGYAGLLVFFDETETVLLNNSRRSKQTHLAHIRTFIDHMATGTLRGCAVYYAVVEEFMDIAKDNLEALSQRIERVDIPELEGRHNPNPRAVWVDLDELTMPRPQDCLFFEELAERIVGIGQKAGLYASSADRLMVSLKQLAEKHAVGNISEGKVREYVREAAAEVARELDNM